MKIRLAAIVILSFATLAIAHAQRNGLKKIAVMPKILEETSGLEITNSNSIWSHNDDTQPFLYNLDSTGNIIRAIYLNHKNSGWEDLAQDKDHNIYIGGFGNNTNTKKDLKILRVNDPEHNTARVVDADVINYTYEDQKMFPPPKKKMNFDCDAMISAGDALFLFTKNRTEPFDGYTKIYKLPNTAGTYTAQLVDSLFLCNNSMYNCWVTGADISPDGKHLALLGHDKIWLISCFEGTRFAKGKMQVIPLNHFSHKAGIAFFNDQEIYISDELEFGVLGGNLYKLDLGPWLSKACK